MKTFLTLLIRLIGIFLFLFSLIAVIYNFEILDLNLNRGSFGFDLGFNESDTILIIKNIVPGSAAEEAKLNIGDSITSINGRKIIRNEYETVKYLGEPLAGSSATLTLLRDKAEKTITITRKAETVYRKVYLILYYFISPFLMMLYVAVGLWAILKKSPSQQAILISIVCFLIGTLMYTPFDASTITTSLSRTFYLFEIKFLLSDSIILIPSFWLLLFFSFPVKHSFYIKHKYLLFIILFFLPVCTLFIGISIPGNELLKKILGISSLLYVVIGLILGILILLSSSKKAINVAQKRQIRLVMTGIKFGVISILSGWLSLLLFSLLGNVSLLWWFIVPFFLLTEIGGLIIPLTFFNSLYQNKLLETEWALKKKVRYILATSFLFVLYLLIIIFAGNFLINTLLIKDPSLIILLTLLLSITFYPLNSRLQSYLERKIYPEKVKYQESIKELRKRLPAFLDIQVLLTNLSKWFEDIIRVQNVIAFSFAKMPVNTIPFQLDRSDGVLNKIKDGNPFFWDEKQNVQEINIDKDEVKWANENKISISFPMISYGELVGVVNIGSKINNEDFSGQDIEILRDAAQQAAMAIQNLKLQSEYIEKKRLDKELDVARTIQKQLLPNEIPDVTGLNISGKMRPCFEVAGDYFDIIKIDDNKVVLSIGDVSGKGAGAALLMSNLQAGLRSALRFSHEISHIVFEINNIIHSNTNPSQFITFFIGVWDYKSRKFQYVNAGHNPPVLLKSDGTIKRLEAGGLFLGPIPDMSYTLDEVSFDPGDILVIYTDGIEETFNKNEEPFGDERIIKIINQNKDKKPEEIISDLFVSLDDFSEGMPYADDATIIVAKSTA